MRISKEVSLGGAACEMVEEAQKQQAKGDLS